MKNVLQSWGGRWEGREGRGLVEGGREDREEEGEGRWEREGGVYPQSREDGDFLSVCNGCVRSVRGECVGGSSDSRAL